MLILLCKCTCEQSVSAQCQKHCPKMSIGGVVALEQAPVSNNSLQSLHNDVLEVQLTLHVIMWPGVCARGPQASHQANILH